jgi:hypothetical protein
MPIFLAQQCIKISCIVHTIEFISLYTAYFQGSLIFKKEGVPNVENGTPSLKSSVYNFFVQYKTFL